LAGVAPPAARPDGAVFGLDDPAVLERIRLIRNIGKFDSVSACANIALPKLTLIYAENGRGKTTLSAILRSLGSSDPIPIFERKRLSASQPPHVVVQPAVGSAINFQGGAWTQTFPNLAVFDDVFVDQNVYSGLSVESGHRQNLHELILGAQGVTLGKAFQALVDRNEEHNKALRLKGDAVPASARGAMGAEELCALQARPAIDEESCSCEAAEDSRTSSRQRSRDCWKTGICKLPRSFANTITTGACYPIADSVSLFRTAHTWPFPSTSARRHSSTIYLPILERCCRAAAPPNFSTMPLPVGELGRNNRRST
jgi:hypothetical protein